MNASLVRLFDWIQANDGRIQALGKALGTDDLDAVLCDALDRGIADLESDMEYARQVIG